MGINGGSFPAIYLVCFRVVLVSLVEFFSLLTDFIHPLIEQNCGYFIISGGSYCFLELRGPYTLMYLVCSLLVVSFDRSHLLCIKTVVLFSNL